MGLEVINMAFYVIIFVSLGPALNPTPQQEAGRLEEELLQLHARIQELEAQLAAVGGDEGAALQVTIALSSCEHEVEEKRRRLSVLQVCVRPAGVCPSCRCVSVLQVCVRPAGVCPSYRCVSVLQVCEQRDSQWASPASYCMIYAVASSGYSG